MIFLRFLLIKSILQLFIDYLSASKDGFPQCVFVQSDSFENCTDEKAVFHHVRDPHEYRSALRKNICVDKSICEGVLRITYFERQLYNDEVFSQFVKMLDGCCGGCANFTVAHKLSLLANLNQTILNESDVVFPMIGRKSSKSSDNMYGFHYISVFDVPSSYYFTKSGSDKEKLGKLIYACLNTWPLIITCILLAFIAGFIVWLFERRENRSEFPNQFLVGLMEAFWWSFVSMTTVGYGDKVPKTVPARVFAVLWVLIGITIFSLLTGSLTNKVNDINKYNIPSLYGKIVGGLNSRLHEATLVAQHGGVFIGLEYNSTLTGIVELMRQVNEEIIDGFILSRPTYYHFTDHIKRHPEYKVLYDKFTLDLNEKKYINEKLTIGILVKDERQYEYFRSYYEDNRLQIQDCLDFEINHEANHVVNDSSKSHFEGYFYDVFYAILVLICVIVFFGLLDLIKRRAHYCFCLKNQSKAKNKKNDLTTTKEEYNIISLDNVLRH